jgi:glycosyltransferase involved in cell wall biosynthesis
LDNVRVSVVIPVHNEEVFLEAVVTKIVGCEANEIIIVDDGSTDKSRDIARKLEELIPKIKTFRLKRNSEGCGFPREFGTRAATGEYVAFCDADIINIDRVDYGKILKAARARRADLIIGNYTGKVGRITNFVAKPMLRLFFPEIRINRVKTGLFCSNRKLLEQFLQYTRFSRWNSTLSLLIFAYMNKYTVIEVDIGELHHTMKPDTELVQQAEGAIKLILAWAGYYGRTGILSSLTPPGFRRDAELPPFINSQVEKGGLCESESLLNDE